MNGGGVAMVFAFFGVVDWWRYLGENLGFDGSVLVTDLRGKGDVSVTAEFYRELKHFRRASAHEPGPLSETEVADVIARCRTLRWLDPHLARSMAQAMSTVFDRVLETYRPALIVSFPIDRYVMDVLRRRAAARGIPYFELTASVFSGMSMLLHRGSLIEAEDEPDAALIESKKSELVHPHYVASYVPGKRRYTLMKFIRTLTYFRVRALALKAISWWQRDPNNCHFLDAQPFLGHKCQWKDMDIVKLVDTQWASRLDRFPREKRALFGLQLFPEASIDYWIPDTGLISHEDMLTEAVQEFSDAGYLVLVKDHPLQFGFRQTGLLKRLLDIDNTILVPYEVGANELLELVGVNFTCTGTLGLQAALLGLKSVVTESYYSNERDFIVFTERGDIADLPARVEGLEFTEPLESRQRRIIARILRGSFQGNLFSFRNFDINNPSADALQLAQALGQRLRRLARGG